MHLGASHPENARHPELRVPSDVASMFLDEPQERKHGRLGVLVARHDFPGFAFELGQLQRSSSPPIMFTEPKVGIRSASMSPSSSLWRADMMAKQGGRHRNR